MPPHLYQYIYEYLVVEVVEFRMGKIHQYLFSLLNNQNGVITDE